MRTFKPGDRVRVVNGPRAGTVTTVLTGLYRAVCSHGDAHAAGTCFCDDGSPMVHDLDLRSQVSARVAVAAPPDWLEPFWEGKESSEWTADLRKLCGIGTKERESA